MHVHFRDDIQKKHYEALSKRPMQPTRYPDSYCLETLGIEPNIRSMCSQLDWDEYSKSKNVTYRNLTLEFLSSLAYEPYSGRGFNRGNITFRLFRHEYTYNYREFAKLLGFQYGPAVVAEISYDRDTQDKLDTFWGAITTKGNLDPSTQFSTYIHRGLNPCRRNCCTNRLFLETPKLTLSPSPVLQIHPPRYRILLRPWPGMKSVLQD